MLKNSFFIVSLHAYIKTERFMNNYKNIKAKVLRIDEEEHKFVIEVEDKIYKNRNSIDFQEKATHARNPKHCRMSNSPTLGKVFIAQNIEHLMRQHYKEYDEVDFKIKMTVGDCYHLEDQYGFTAILNQIPLSMQLLPQE